MKFGLVYDFRNPEPWRRPWADFYAETLDHVAAVESMGFDTVWLTEHHFVKDGYLPSVLTMAAAVAGRTSRVTIGAGSVMLLPLHDPLRVAEDAAVVDILSRGRLRMGFGIGYVEEEFEAFGVTRSARAPLLEESIEIIRKAWRPEPIRHTGTRWQLPEVDVHPKPLQEGGPQIYIGGRAETPIRRAARIGDGAIIDARRLHWYYDELEKLGRTEQANACVYVLSTPTDDPEAAVAKCGPFVDYRQKEYVQWYGAAGDLPSDRRAVEIMRGEREPSPRAAALPSFLTPEAMLRELRSMADRGATEAWWFATFPGLAPSETLPYWEVLASEVMPHLRS